MSLKINALIAASALTLATAALAQTQTTPGDASQNAPAATGATASGKTNSKAAVKRAVEADFKSGATVYDSAGAVLGTIDSFTSASATINTGKVRAAIPLSSFGKGETGLVLGMTKADFDAAASAAAPKKAPAKAE